MATAASPSSTVRSASHSGMPAAFSAGALTLELVNKSKWEAANEDPGNMELREEGERFQAVGRTFIVLAGAAMAATVTLFFFTDFDDHDDAEQVGARPWFGDRSAGLALEGRF